MYSNDSVYVAGPLSRALPRDALVGGQPVRGNVRAILRLQAFAQSILKPSAGPIKKKYKII